MDDPYANERAALRAERERLTKEFEELQRITAALEGSGDAARLHAHADRLVEHRAAERAYHDALADFHDRAGPVGW